MFSLTLTADLGYTIEQLAKEALVIAERVGVDIEFTHKRIDVYVFRGEPVENIVKRFNCVYLSRGEQ